MKIEFDHEAINNLIIESVLYGYYKGINCELHNKMNQMVNDHPAIFVDKYLTLEFEDGQEFLCPQFKEDEAFKSLLNCIKLNEEALVNSGDSLARHTYLNILKDLYKKLDNYKKK